MTNDTNMIEVDQATYEALKKIADAREISVEQALAEVVAMETGVYAVDEEGYLLANEIGKNNGKSAEEVIGELVERSAANEGNQ